tara:strand:- start:1093 stop:1389 length:297 start_codon:yes stop_codon:yes gene_type:complete
MSLKEIYIESLKSHDWNYERHVDSKFDIGVKQKDKIRSIIAEAYELGKDPAKIFYSICPEHLYKASADYGIRTPWEELLLDQEIQKEENQKKFNDVKY